MMQVDPGTAIVLSGFGAVSAVGLDGRQTCASLRSGVCRYAEHAFYRCLRKDPNATEEEPLIAAPVAVVDPLLEGPERLLKLALLSLQDLLRTAGLTRSQLEDCGLFLALPQGEDVVVRWDLENRFLSLLRDRTNSPLAKGVRMMQGGHAGFFVLVSEATAAMAAGRFRSCLVGGVDSYLTLERLECIDDAWRLKSERNVDGFTPGEAGAWVLLKTMERTRSRSTSPLGTIVGVGVGAEPLSIRSDRASSGKGLSEAIAQACDGAGQEGDCGWVLCDLNGESYRAQEWGIAVTRLGRLLSGVKRLSHPADLLGDVGAATGGILLAHAAQAFGRGHAPSAAALLWTGSDDGTRAALRVNRA